MIEPSYSPTFFAHPKNGFGSTREEPIFEGVILPGDKAGDWRVKPEIRFKNLGRGCRRSDSNRVLFLKTRFYVQIVWCGRRELNPYALAGAGF